MSIDSDGDIISRHTLLKLPSSKVKIGLNYLPSELHIRGRYSGVRKVGKVVGKLLRIMQQQYQTTLVYPGKE